MPNVVRQEITRYNFPEMIDELGITTGIEVGVNHGAYSYYLLRHTKLQRLVSIDQWTGKWADRERDARGVLSEFGDRSEVLKMTSHDASQHLAGRKFGFIYIDGNHRYRGVKQDIVDYDPLLDRPGILAGHDYISEYAGGVVRAVNEYADQHSLDIHVTREPWGSWYFVFKG